MFLEERVFRRCWIALQRDSKCRFDLVCRIWRGGLHALCKVRRHGDGELIVELGEGLERGDGDVPSVHKHGGVSAIEGGHPWLLLAADDEPIDRSSVDAGILGVCEVVFVMRAVSGFINDEVLEAWAFHGQVELSCGLENGIANGFRFEASPVLSPEQGVIGIFLLGGADRFGGGTRRLLVRFAGHDESVKRFQRPLRLVAEPDGEPVEKFWVRRGGTHFTEVVGGFDEATTKMELPDTVNDAAPGERIIGMGYPSCECGTALGFASRSGNVREGQVQGSTDGGKRAWANGIAGLFDVPTAQEVDGAGLPAFRSGSLESAGTGVNPSCINFLRSRHGWDGFQFGSFGEEGIAGRIVGLSEEKLVSFLEKLFFVFFALWLGSDAVRQVLFSPARRCFDAVERSDGFSSGDIRPVFDAEDFEFSECEDVVLASLCKFCGGDAHVAATHAVVFRGAGFERGKAGVRKIIHEGGVMFFPDKEDVLLKRGIVTDLDFEADGKTESAADFAEVVVTRFQDDALNVDGFAKVDLNPLGGFVGGCDGAVITVIGCCVGV